MAKLGQRLDLTLHPRQFVQSHTPYLDLVPEFGQQTVLVLGGHGQQIRDLAHAYGFMKVVTSSDGTYMNMPCRQRPHPPFLAQRDSSL